VAEVKITPRCANGENIFISSEGWLLPCCYSHIYLRQVMAAAHKFNKNDRWFLDNMDLFDLSARSVDEIVKDPRWKDLQDSWSSGSAPRVCYRTCGVPLDSTFQDANEVHKRDRTVTPLNKAS
jgi:hypothetical protein